MVLSGQRASLWGVAGVVMLTGAMSCGHSSEEAKVPSTVAQADPTKLFQTAQLYAQAGDNVKAEHYFNAARTAGYPRRAVLEELLRVCLEASRLRSALNYALRELEVEPDDVALRALAGSLYVGLGQPDRGLEQLRFALELDPNAPQVLFLYGKTLWQVSADPAATRLYYERYLQVDSAGKHGREVRRWLAAHPASGEVAAATGQSSSVVPSNEQAIAPPAADVAPQGETSP